MKRTALFILICLGLSPVLFSSCSSVGGTTENGMGPAYAQAPTEGSAGVQWYGGNDFNNQLPTN
jgi:hypothetical protein